MKQSRSSQLRQQADTFNAQYAKYPSMLLRRCFVEGKKLVGILTSGSYQPLKCGCKATGNGSLQFPFTVEQCAFHKRVKLTKKTKDSIHLIVPTK